MDLARVKAEVRVQEAERLYGKSESRRSDAKWPWLSETRRSVHCNSHIPRTWQIWTADVSSTVPAHRPCLRRVTATLTRRSAYYFPLRNHAAFRTTPRHASGESRPLYVAPTALLSSYHRRPSPPIQRLHRLQTVLSFISDWGFREGSETLPPSRDCEEDKGRRPLVTDREGRPADESKPGYRP